MDMVIVGKDETESNRQKSLIKSILPDSRINIRMIDDPIHTAPDPELVYSDVVFMDMDSLGQGGINLARSISESGRVNVILVISDHRYDMEAFSIRASGILYKPVVWERMKYEISNLRYPRR